MSPLKMAFAVFFRGHLTSMLINPRQKLSLCNKVVPQYWRAQGLRWWRSVVEIDMCRYRYMKLLWSELIMTLIKNLDNSSIHFDVSICKSMFWWKSSYCIYHNNSRHKEANQNRTEPPLILLLTSYYIFSLPSSLFCCLLFLWTIIDTL